MKALDVAAHIINRCIDMGTPISNLKLQKIMYFLDITYLINRHRRLIDDNFEAWQYGPVIEEVYDRYSPYAANFINIRQDPNEDFPQDDLQRINAKIDNLANTDVWRLVELSHKSDSPWKKTYKEGQGNHEIIDNSLLFEYAETIRKKREINGVKE
ncbi:Panacea domain-containing protein [Campylobacter sp. 7477a]|uniref:Panacea domain-containing protein n=1 Tax=Campylobacter sp. 7477a TaxID=2735741 RepID=UPI00301503DA|nr:DUF4065 domain-containing protein [Campylobacter sp. 7477a]